MEVRKVLLGSHRDSTLVNLASLHFSFFLYPGSLKAYVLINVQ